MSARSCPQNDVPDVAGDRRIRPELPGEHSEDEDRAFSDGRIIGGHIEDQEDVDDHHEDVRAKHCAQRAAAPAAKLRAADHNRREHLQQQRVADQRISGTGLSAEEDPSQAIEASRDHVDHELDKLRPHADSSRRVNVAADGIDCDAEIGALEPCPERERENDEQGWLWQQVRDGVANQKITEGGRHLASRLVHYQQGDALQDEHGCEGHDDGLHPQHSDEEAVEGARGHADANPGRDNQQRRQIWVLKRRGEGYVDERNRCAGRKIKAARQNDDRLTDRRQRQRCTTGRHLREVVVAQPHRADAGDRREKGKKYREGD